MKSKDKKAGGYFSALGFSPAPPCYGRVVLAICGFALVLSPMVLVATVAAHSDVDPEIAEITAELAEQPDNVALLLRRGRLYRFNGKLIESLNDLEQAWLLDRENRQVALERSHTLVALGRESEAEAALDQYLEGESVASRAMALAARAQLYSRTGRANLAIADFSEALKLYPTVELYMERGHLQEALGQLDDAAAGYVEGLGKLPQAGFLRKELIRVKTAQGRNAEALILIDQELALAPVKTEWYLRRGKILAAMGQTAAAKSAQEQALKEANRALAKRSTAIHLLARAKVYEAMGDREEAKRDLRMALQKAPRFTQASKLLEELEAR